MTYEKVTEGLHTAEFILSEGNGYRSRETVTLAEGESVKAGELLGKITSGGEYAAWDPAAGDGSETIAGISYAEVDATDAAASITAVVRDAEVDLGALVYPEENSAGDGGAEDATAGLLTLGIITRARGA